MIKVIELSNPEVSSLVDRLCTQEVSLNTAKFLFSLRSKISDSLTSYDLSRIELLKQFGKKKEDGSLDLVDGVVQFEDDNGIVNFTKEVEKIANVNFEKLSITSSDINCLKLSANDFTLFSLMVDIID